MVASEPGAAMGWPGPALPPTPLGGVGPWWKPFGSRGATVRKMDRARGMRGCRAVGEVGRASRAWEPRAAVASFPPPLGPRSHLHLSGLQR